MIGKRAETENGNFLVIYTENEKIIAAHYVDPNGVQIRKLKDANAAKQAWTDAGRLWKEFRPEELTQEFAMQIDNNAHVVFENKEQKNPGRNRQVLERNSLNPSRQYFAEEKRGFQLFAEVWAK